MPRNNYIYHQEADGWLKLHRQRLEWEEAVVKCSSEGAILASPVDANFSKAITSVMCAAPVFTGISNVFSSSEYQSMEGVSISNMCFLWPESIEPELNDTQTNCIAMDANGVATVISCSERLPFVCYRKRVRKLSECGVEDSGYVLDKRTGSCYKGYTEYLHWNEAYKRCAMDGAHLAIINSWTEAKVIYELVEKIDTAPRTVSIGFHAFGHQSTWLTIHGQSLNDAGYADWVPDSTKSSYLRCGAVCGSEGSRIEDGILCNVLCENISFRFICEINPNNIKASTNNN